MVHVSSDLFLYFERTTFYDLSAVKIGNCTREFLINNYRVIKSLLKLVTFIVSFSKSQMHNPWKECKA